MEAHFVYYDPQLSRKVSAKVASSGAVVTHTVPGDMLTGWVNYEDEDEWVLVTQRKIKNHRLILGQRCPREGQRLEAEVWSRMCRTIITIAAVIIGMDRPSKHITIHSLILVQQNHRRLK